MIFCFGEHELDEERFELRRGGAALPLQPKVFELLLYLVRHSDRVVSKSEILEQVWPDSRVTDGSIARAVSLARRAIDDRGDRHAVIATVARQGYRFRAPQHTRLGAAVGDGSGERYVGRGPLLARLSETLATALSGRGRILFLAGEAGIGKTRTAEVLAQRARSAGAVVATAWGGEAGAPAYWTWTRALRSLTQLLPGGVARLSPRQRAALTSLLPELEADSAGPRATPGGKESARVELFESVQALLGCCAAERPLALFLDDLHVGGAESLELLEFIGQTLDALPIAIVATCREDEATRARQPARALERLLRLRALERWPLAGLGVEEVREFVRGQRGAEPDPALISALEQQTGGNPLLLGESLRSLEARGLLRESREEKAWEALLPRGIEHLLYPKVRRLSAGAAEALRCAAAIGVELERDLLASCLPAGFDLDARLRELEDAALLFPVASPALRLRFAHVLVRHALYEELVPAGAGRRALHARIAAALPAEDTSADVVAERAHHACEAAPLVAPRRAGALAQMAAEHASRLHDFERAASWYQRALAVLELDSSVDPVTQAVLGIALGAAQTRAVGLECARASYRAAAQHARSAARSDLLAAAALGFADRPNATGHADSEVIELLGEAASAVPATSEALRVRLLSRLAGELRYSDPARAGALVDQAVAAARRLDDPAALAQALDDSTYVHWGPEDPEKWVARNVEVVRSAQAAGDLELELAGQKGVVTGHLELGDVAGVDRELRSCERLAEAMRTSYARWLLSASRAMRSLVDGELDLAERHVGDSIRLGERVDSREVALQLQAQLVYLRLEQGRASEIEPAARALVQRFPDAPAWRAALARLLAATDRLGEARLELARLARERFLDVPRDRGWLPALALAAEVAFANEDSPCADLLDDLLTPFASLHVVAGSGLVYYGSVAYHLGLLDLARSRWDAAVARLEQALTAEARAGARVWEARARLARARALRGRGLPGDRPLAVKLAAAVSERARAAGWVEVAAEARAVESALWSQRSGSRSARRSLASES